MPKTIPAQTDFRIRGKDVTSTLTAAGKSTLERMRVGKSRGPRVSNQAITVTGI
jgi:hypothetical protein